VTWIFGAGALNASCLQMSVLMLFSLLVVFASSFRASEIMLPNLWANKS
jgi:hypothetical protein